MLRQVRKFLQHACTVGTRLTHAEDAARADIDTRLADRLEGVQPVLEGARGDHVAVELRRGVQVVVVIVQTGVGQAPRLRPAEHPQGDAGLHPQTAYGRDHVDHLVQVLVGRVAPGRAHAETGRAIGLGRLRRLDHFFERQQLFALQAGVVFRALRAIGAVFGAGAGLDRQQGADLHLVGVEMRPVHHLRAKQQVVERQREQRPDLVQRPVVAQFVVDFHSTHLRPPRQVHHLFWARRYPAIPHGESS